MINKKTGILILFGIFCIKLQAQKSFLNTAEETKELSAKVTQLFKESKISAAIKELKTYWPLPSEEIDNMEEKTIKYLDMIEERFGKAEGFLKVKEETIKDIAIRETYLIKYQNTATRLIFTYYKNKTGWIVNAFKWDDSFTDEFQ